MALKRVIIMLRVAVLLLSMLQIQRNRSYVKIVFGGITLNMFLWNAPFYPDTPTIISLLSL